MTMENEIVGIGFTSLVTVDESVFDASIGFYEKLGFRLVKMFVKGSSAGEDRGVYKSLFGIGTRSLKEVWIESFPLQNLDINGCIKPWQELNVYDGDNSERLSDSTLLKLRLSTVDGVKTFPRELLFFSTDLKRLKSILKNELKVEFNDVHNEVQTKDPFGNTLIFSNRETPLSKESFDSPEEFLDIRSKELMAQITKESKQRKITELDKAKSLHPKKKIAVMTSGGDAPGMNAVVRAVVRAGIYFDCDVFAIYEGYRGLVQGGDLLRKMDWGDVKSYLSLGGTNIGTARCKEFRERSGRLLAAYNMIVNGIGAIVVCGGDGSLTGADLFRQEWPSLLKELIDTGKLTKDQTEPHKHLCIVGLVGSIDNDMARTDSTIGAFSSLERITEMVDYIDETATSHSRAFVVEVMGRHCGWLALMSGIATGSDYIFIPERPPKAGQWQEELKAVCLRHRQLGKRNTTVIVAEGAIDDELNPLSVEEVKDVLSNLGLDTRITTLGHVQRGGTAVAFDRTIATLQGVEAVKAIMELKPTDPSPMIGILQNKIVRTSLVDAVKLTKSVATAIEQKDFDKALGLRDSSFEDAYKHYMSITLHDDGSKRLPLEERLNIGVVHVGAPSAGLNSCTRAIALYCISKGHKLFAIQNGFSGLIENAIVKELTWLDVEGWHNKGGSEIGTNRSLPSMNFGRVAFEFQKYNLNGLIIIGGFEAFTAIHQLYQHRSHYPIFEIPMVVIPATVSNNVPGTEYSLGTDTCLNQLVNYCDVIKQSASSTRRRVFVVEVQGGNSGFVASCAGLITGSIATYTPEKSIYLKTIQEDIDLLFRVFQDDRGEDRNGKIIIRNERASTVYTSELIANIIKEAAAGRFETRTAIPGHVQQGFTPSSMDRVNAVKFGVKSCEFLEKWNTELRTQVNESGAVKALKWTHASKEAITMHLEKENFSHSAVVIGIQGANVTFSPISYLYEKEANLPLRKGTRIHWHHLVEVTDILSGRLMLRKQAAK